MRWAPSAVGSMFRAYSHSCTFWPVMHAVGTVEEHVDQPKTIDPDIHVSSYPRLWRSLQIDTDVIIKDDENVGFLREARRPRHVGGLLRGVVVCLFGM
jgi:hypothetical protein